MTAPDPVPSAPRATDPSAVRQKRRFWAQPNPSATLGHIDLLWKGARGMTAAIVIAAFPVIFIVDDVVETTLSPVLPALVVLILLIIGLPFFFMEVAQRRLLRMHEDLRPARVLRTRSTARLMLTVAIAWFVAWLALGV